MRIAWLVSTILLFPIGFAVGDEPTTKPTSIIAEGSGVDEKEALEDAFRQAVRQVVGLMVDAETLVENDELVRDKVLTYSGGFIVDYEKLGESSRGGVTRVRIQANVARQSLRQRLEASKITVKETDGKGMFAEAVTKLEANQSAEQLLAKSLQNFPQAVLIAKHPARPMIVSQDSAGAKLTLNVTVSVDQTAYKQFVDQLSDFLSRAAIEQGAFVAKYKFFESRREDERTEWSRYEPELFNTGKQWESLKNWIPQAFSSRGTEMTGTGLYVAVTNKVSSGGKRLSSKWFQVDESLLPTIQEAVNQPINLVVKFLDSSGGEVAVEHAVVKNRVRRDREYFAGTPVSSCYGSQGQWAKVAAGTVPPGSHIVWFHPVHPQAYSADVWFRTSLELPIEVTLTLDELKSVHSIACQFTK